MLQQLIWILQSDIKNQNPVILTHKQLEMHKCVLSAKAPGHQYPQC